MSSHPQHFSLLVLVIRTFTSEPSSFLHTCPLAGFTIRCPSPWCQAKPFDSSPHCVGCAVPSEIGSAKNHHWVGVSRCIFVVGTHMDPISSPRIVHPPWLTFSSLLLPFSFVCGTLLTIPLVPLLFVNVSCRLMSFDPSFRFQSPNPYCH